MARNDGRGMVATIALVGLGTGVLLGRGLELCFGIGQYRMIMLFGGLGGLGIAIATWLGRIALERREPRKVSHVVALAAGSGLCSFLIYFLWRVLPLIQEEIKYGL